MNNPTTANTSANTTNRSKAEVIRYVGEPLPELARVMFIVVGVVCIVIDVLGNVVVMVTVAANKRMHNPHYVFIVNLAISDLIITGRWSAGCQGGKFVDRWSDAGPGEVCG